MVTVLVLYRRPADPEAFDRQYFDTHVPLVLRTPGLVSFDVSRGAVTSDDDVYLVARLAWESMESFRAAMRSPEAAASQVNLDGFAAGAYTTLRFESIELLDRP